MPRNTWVLLLTLQFLRSLPPAALSPCRLLRNSVRINAVKNLFSPSSVLQGLLLSQVRRRDPVKGGVRGEDFFPVAVWP